MKWLVIYTKSNFEIRVAETLNKIGIKAYCPTYRKVVQYSDRKKKVIKPLLPSYVLVYINESERRKVFSVPGVVRYIFWLGKPAEVRAKEISVLKSSLSSIIKSFSIEQIKRGSNFTVPNGPFMGREGKVIDHSKQKLKLELRSLGVLVTLTLA